MKAIKFQEKYIKEIVDESKKLLDDEYREDKDCVIVFKAPTGSGKTYMISEAITKLVKEQTNKSYAFIWLSVNSLHEQSRESLIQYLDVEKLLNCISINEIENNTIEQNEIVFINWDSLIKKNNTFMMDNEQNWNLQSVIENTKEENNEIILIIDESHRTAKAEKAKDVIAEISPKLIIEMTATPKDVSGKLIDIPFQEVIYEGMIKKEILINPSCGKIKENKDLLDVALKKRTVLKRQYQNNNIDINPLLLIQIPNKKQTDSTNPEDYIIGLLAEHDITQSNGRLAIRLSGVDIKELDEKVKPHNSPIDVLIFKEAIALGWDCPRASLLFLQREWKQERYEFNIQTLGRIMRMPEQKHYDTCDMLNAGYVYSASDNFEIVEELASNYVSELQMQRDEELNTKPLKLHSEFIRRKREQTNLSGDFKKCLFDTANKLNTENEINLKANRIRKTIVTDGAVTEIDQGGTQQIEFSNKQVVTKDIKEVADSYVNFCADNSNGYAKYRSTNTIKSAIRSWFKENFNIGDEDNISTIVMSNGNKLHIKILLEKAKEKYANLPTKEEKVIVNAEWEVPEVINIFTDEEKISASNKSIIKNLDTNRLHAKINKNGNIEFSSPEINFIEKLDKTDDDILWWFKNGVSENKYFGIAYKKADNHYYGFYPDFIIKTKQETIIVEIKSDKDFKPENALKLQAGKDYITRVNNTEKVSFYMLSPADYENFFSFLKSQNLSEFKSLYEEKLLRYAKSQKTITEDKTDKTDKDEENLDLWSELDKTIDELEDQQLKNELLEMELETARINIKTLSKTANNTNKKEIKKLNIKKPFNICVLGECSDKTLIKKELNQYFEKIGIKTVDWSIDFSNNKKLENSNLLRSLHKGQSKFSLIVTGQIHHHSGKGNTKANILSELKNEKYIPHCTGGNPKDLLTPEKMIETINQYIESK